MSATRRFGWLGLVLGLIAAGALTGCSAPTVADACRNICACDRLCGPTDANGTQARCEAESVAGQETAVQNGCTTEYDALVACVYNASCAELATGCTVERDALSRCEIPGPV